MLEPAEQERCSTSQESREEKAGAAAAAAGAGGQTRPPGAMLRPELSLTLTASRQPASDGCKGRCRGGSGVASLGRGQVGFWRACPVHQQEQQLTSGGRRPPSVRGRMHSPTTDPLLAWPWSHCKISLQLYNPLSPHTSSRAGIFILSQVEMDCCATWHSKVK